MLSPPSGTARPCHPEKQTATVERPGIGLRRANFGQNGATVPNSGRDVRGGATNQLAERPPQRQRVVSCGRRRRLLGK